MNSKTKSPLKFYLRMLQSEGINTIGDYCLNDKETAEYDLNQNTVSGIQGKGDHSSKVRKLNRYANRFNKFETAEFSVFDSILERYADIEEEYNDDD